MTRAPASALILLLSLMLWSCASNRSWLDAPPAPRDRPVTSEGAFTRKTLDNGLTLMVLEDRRLPRVALGVSVRRGGGSVSRDQAGIASYTAEVMKRGAGDKGALAFAQSVDALGASLGVGAGWDSMSVTISGLSRDLDALSAILSDVVLRPRFEAKEAKSAKAEQLAGLEQAKDDPATLVAWAAWRTLYPEHRYGLPMDGTPESVARFDASGARRFYESVFSPENAIFFVSGDVDAADVAARAESLFADWKKSSIRAETPAPPAVAPPARKVLVVDRPDLGQAQIILAQEGIARTYPERIAASIMNNVLGGGGFSSRLMKSVRAEAGLTYGVNSGFALRRRPGPFRISTFTRAKETRRVIDLLLQGVRQMGSDPPTGEELEKAKSYLTGGFGLGLETSQAVISALVDLDVYGLPEDALDTFRGRVRAVTTADTALQAKELLDPDRMAIVVLGPAEGIVPLLAGLGEIEVVEP